MSDEYSQIAADTQDGILVITVTDSELREFDKVNSLEKEMIRAAEQSGLSHVVLDLANVKMMASVGLMALLGLRAHLRKSERRLVLCNLSDMVAQVLTVSELLVETRQHARHMELANDLEAALALLQESD